MKTQKMVDALLVALYHERLSNNTTDTDIHSDTRRSASDVLRHNPGQYK
jgi:hypothetical protein